MLNIFTSIDTFDACNFYVHLPFKFSPGKFINDSYALLACPAKNNTELSQDFQCVKHDDVT